MKIKKTKRGFATATFTDQYGVVCSIQKSSIATEDCIWLGADDIGLTVGMPWRTLSKEDIKTELNASEVIANNRMHLNRKQVKKLLPLLIKFVETGEL